MVLYRLYEMSKDRIVGPSDEIEFASDQEATEHAKARMKALDIEIWQGTRLVTRLKSSET
jgi:hypothetical protein